MNLTTIILTIVATFFFASHIQKLSCLDINQLIEYYQTRVDKFTETRDKLGEYANIALIIAWIISVSMMLCVLYLCFLGLSTLYK